MLIALICYVILETSIKSQLTVGRNHEGSAAEDMSLLAYMNDSVMVELHADHVKQEKAEQQRLLQ